LSELHGEVSPSELRENVSPSELRGESPSSELCGEVSIKLTSSAKETETSVRFVPADFREIGICHEKSFEIN